MARPSIQCIIPHHYILFEEIVCTQRAAFAESIYHFPNREVGPVPGPEIRANEPPAPVEIRGLDRRFFVDDNRDCVCVC